MTDELVEYGAGFGFFIRYKMTSLAPGTKYSGGTIALNPAPIRGPIACMRAVAATVPLRRRPATYSGDVEELLTLDTNARTLPEPGRRPDHAR